MKNTFTYHVTLASLSVLVSLGLCVAPSFSMKASNTLKAARSLDPAPYVWEEAPDSEWPTEEQPALAPNMSLGGEPVIQETS